MFWQINIGTSEQNCVIGKLAKAGPNFLTVDDPVVAIAHGASAERSQVAARTRFAEELAPHLFALQDGGEVMLLLFGCSVGDECWSNHADRHCEGTGRHVKLRHLFGKDG